MDTKALRQKILDLAIRGKLVPQDPNDEPASVLLERIREQKKQMVKEGKLKAKDIKNDSIIYVGEDSLHYEKFADGSVKCIEDEIPFELPEGWTWTRLQCVTTIQSSKRVFEKDYVNDGIPFYRSKEIGDLSRNEDIRSQLFITEEHYLELKERYGAPKNGDILITSVGSIGNTWICDGREFYYKDGNITQIVANSFFVSEYMQLFLKTDFFFEQVGKTVAGSAYNALTIEKLKNILFILPPYNEQMQIVNALHPYNESIEIVEANRASLFQLLNETKSKILDLAIRGQLVPQNPDDEPASILLERIRSEKEELIKQGKLKRDKKESIIFKGEDNSYYEKFADGKCRSIEDELPFELPDGWEWCNLSMIGTTNIGLTYRPTDIDPDGTMVLRSSNIVNDEIDLNDLVCVKTKIRENQYVQPNDILICARNGSKALVGKCALIGELKEPASFGAFMAVYKTDYYKYVLHYLRSSQFRNIFDDGNSTAINQLTQDMLKRALIPFPPISEQERIVGKISELLSRLRDIKKSLS